MVVLVDNGFPVALSDKETRFFYNLLPVGKFYDKRYGAVNISHETVQKLADNFGKFPSYEVPIKLGHSDGAKSPGKVIGVEAKNTGLEITMLVDDETAKDINNKKYRYMSAEFDENYVDKVTGKNVGAVLLGAALVNQPANPYMQPLMLADDIEGGINPMEEELRRQLNEAKAELEASKKQFSDLENETKKQAEETAKRLADIEAENKRLMEERRNAEKEKHEAEVKALSDTWISKGIPPAFFEKIKPILLNEQTKVIKLSDDTNVSSLKLFGEALELLPKMPMKQLSGSDVASVELSDVEKARARAKAIADAVK